MSKKETRGQRNRNPFNIRISEQQWKGKISKQENTDGVFEQFSNMELGIRAGMIILRTYFYKYRLRTIPQIIGRFAPPSENNTKQYIEFVEKFVKASGCSRENETMYLLRIAQAICLFESLYAIPINKLMAINKKYNIFPKQET